MPDPSHILVHSAGELARALEVCAPLRKRSGKTDVDLTMCGDEVVVTVSTRNCGVHVRVAAETNVQQTVSLGHEQLHKIAATLARRCLSDDGPAGPLDIGIHLQMNIGESYAAIESDALPHGSVTIPLRGDEEPHPWPMQGKARACGTIPHVADLLDVMKRIWTHASTDESRASLNQVYFEHDGTTGRFVATDGHRLAVLSTRFDFPKIEPVVLPYDLIHALPALSEPFEMRIDDHHVFLDSDSGRAWGRLGAAKQFPPWRQVIPKSFMDDDAPMLEVEARRLEEAVRLAGRLSDRTHPAVRIEAKSEQLSERLSVSMLGYHDEPSLKSSFQVSGTPSSPEAIDINAYYLVEALESLDAPRVRICWVGPLDPFVVSTRDRRALVVIMPVRG